MEEETNIKRVKEKVILGINIDDQMSFDKHISMIVKIPKKHVCIRLTKFPKLHQEFRKKKYIKVKQNMEPIYGNFKVNN